MNGHVLAGTVSDTRYGRKNGTKVPTGSSRQRSWVDRPI